MLVHTIMEIFLTLILCENVNYFYTKKEIIKLRQKTQEKGLGIVPLKLYFINGKVKVEIAVVRGKKLYDKRATEAKRTAEREINRAMRERERR